jgi:hypothetical protein
MMIAMTWPDRFQVGVDRAVTAQAPTRAAPGDRYGYGPAYGSRGYYGSYGCAGWFGRCSDVDLWLAYNTGYYRYGYGLGYSGYSPWYGGPRGWYSGPRYIVVAPGSEIQPRGTMTRDGYRPPPGTGNNARPAQPRGSDGGAQSAPARPTTSSPPASSTGSTDRRPPSGGRVVVGVGVGAEDPRASCAGAGRSGPKARDAVAG